MARVGFLVTLTHWKFHIFITYHAYRRLKKKFLGLPLFTSDRNDAPDVSFRKQVGLLVGVSGGTVALLHRTYY